MTLFHSLDAIDKPAFFQPDALGSLVTKLVEQSKADPAYVPYGISHLKNPTEFVIYYYEKDSLELRQIKGALTVKDDLVFESGLKGFTTIKQYMTLLNPKFKPIVNTVNSHTETMETKEIKPPLADERKSVSSGSFFPAPAKTTVSSEKEMEEKANSFLSKLEENASLINSDAECKNPTFLTHLLIAKLKKGGESNYFDYPYMLAIKHGEIAQGFHPDQIRIINNFFKILTILEKFLTQPTLTSGDKTILETYLNRFQTGTRKLILEKLLPHMPVEATPTAKVGLSSSSA